MRDSQYTLVLNLPNNDVLMSIHPISRGPYAGHDILMVMDDLCGKAYVVRATLKGEHLSVSEKIWRKEVDDLVEKMLRDQGNKDCDAVTGGGRWSCD